MVRGSTLNGFLCKCWIMFTVGNVDRYIGRHSIDIAVDSRSPVDRQSADYRSTGNHYQLTGNREVVDCRSIVDRLSIDRAINHQPSIRRYFVDAPRPNIGYMSGGISVNCW